MRQRQVQAIRQRVLGALVVGFVTVVGGCNSDNSSALVLTGTVEARETALAFQVDGRIEKLLIDEGQLVTAGQTAALLIDQDYRLAVNRTRAEMAAAEAALALLEAGSRSQEVQVAAATLDQALAERRFAEAEEKRIRRLVASKLASQEQLDQATLKQDIAASAVRRTEQQLQLLQEGARQEELDKARAELAARRSALEAAEQWLSYTRLASPVSGLVTLRQAEAGEVIGAGQPVFKVAELSRPWVRAYLNETDLARVRLGQRVQVTVDGLPDRAFDGVLSFISPKAEFTPKSVETRALRVDLVYRVKIQLEDPDGVLKLGMPADVVLDSRK